MWACHKQTATSLCTAEAETVSLKDCIKADAIAIQDLFSLILKRPVKMQVLEDNTACITGVNKGYSPALRHLKRRQRTSLGYLHEIFYEQEGQEGSGLCELCYGPTADHKGDVFTKEIHSVPCFHKRLCALGLHNSRSEFERGERVNLNGNSSKP